MSNRERKIALLDSIPDYKMAYVQGITAGEKCDQGPVKVETSNEN